MNWFRRSSRSPSVNRFGSSSRSATPTTATMNGDRGVALSEAFQSHWAQANAVIVQQQQHLQEPSVEQLTTVFRHLDQMMLLLVTEVNSQTDLCIGPVLDSLFTENVLQRVLLWTQSFSGDLSEQCRRLLLRLYEGLLNQSQFCLLVHKPILLPMLTLLEDCSSASPQQPDVEQLFVLLLNQICAKITDKDKSPLLEFFFNRSSDEGPPKFLVFTFLIPYLYREGNVGQLARDALLLLLSVSASVDSVAEFIAEHSNFCPVLATGLSALYSSLPRRLSTRADDWHRITEADIDSVADLRSFYNALEFCNAVVQVGHIYVLNRLLDYIYQGFLVSVLGAALHENSLEELIAATAYLELFLRTATEPPLSRILLKFILAEEYDGVVLLETLVTRISSNSRLCVVSLALFETLLNLNCEDLMFELVFKYLIPCTHIMVSQASNLMDVDYHGRSAQRFLSLIPNCCVSFNTGGISSASSASSLNAADSGPAEKASGDNVNLSSSYPFTVAASALSTGASNNGVVYEIEPDIAVKPREVGYLDYLRDAEATIAQCATACACWRFPYDGRSPDPTQFRDDLAPPSAASAPSSETAKTGEETNVDTSFPPKTDSSADAKNGSDSNGSTTSDGPPEVTVNQQLIADPTAFKRQSSFRKSGTNRYFNVRRTSAVAGAIGPVPELDLTLGGEEEYDESELEAFEAQNQATAHRTGSVESNQSSSDSTTPRRVKKDAMSASMPVDYFKLAFEEDSVYGVSDSQEESDIGGNGGYVLRGWSQMHDMNTFLEVLNRVRSSRTFMQQSVDETLKYIDSIHDSVVQHGVEAKEDAGNAMMVVSKDSGVDVGEHGDNNAIKNEAIALVIRIPFKSSFASPNIGPFLSVLLHKLDNMLQNSLFTNLHLTGVIARLACYPQILTTSFLLNYSLVFQPAVRSLHQVLTSLRHKVDSYACTVENFETLLLRGRKFLLQRERRYLSETRRRSSRSDSMRTSVSSSSGGGRRSEADSALFPNKNRLRLRPRKSEQRLRSFTQFFQSPLVAATQRDDRPVKNQNRRGGSLDVQPAVQQNFQYFRNKSQSIDVTLEAMKTKNVVYCAIVLDEFLKEMAAISQEHAVRRNDLQQNQHFFSTST